MKLKIVLAIIILLVLLSIGQSSAWVQTPVTYYNNWNNSGVINNLELDIMNPDKYPYKWDFDITNWYFYKNNDTLTLPKSIIDTINFYPDRISFNITTTKSGVLSKSEPNGTEQRYITIPDSALKLRFIFDNVKPDVLIDNGTSQWYADPSTYWYSNVGEQIRFNFQTEPYASLAASDNITFIFNSWLVNNAIISGLTDIGTYSAPTVFTNNSILYLISGNGTGLFTGFNWTGSTWQSDTSIVSGLTDVGSSSAPTVFTNNSILYLISGNVNGAFNGFNWTGSTWQSDTNIISGLGDVGDNSAPTVFTNNSILYLISGKYNGLWSGFNWNGTGWQSDTSIVSGLTDVGTYSTPSVFTNNSILYLISGNTTGFWFGFNWTGSTWRSDTSIVLGLSSVLSSSTPTVFTNNSILYLISGKETGLWSGWNRSYVSGASNPRPNITSWSNDNTSNSTLSFSVNQNTNVTFNITANQTLTSCSWTGATQMNCSVDSYAYKLFDTAGTQYVNFTGSNANGSTLNTINWTITVIELTKFIPPTPISLANTTGNFWVNYTWSAGSGNITDSYNVSQNGTWTNGSSIPFMNTSIGVHNWSNISVYSFNSSGNVTLNQTPISMNTQVTNNIPVQSVIGNKQVTVGQYLNFTVSAIDADSDTITYGTNASKGTFNTTTGNFNWSTTSEDVGTYYWLFNSSDAYGGSDSETITLTLADTTDTTVASTGGGGSTGSGGSGWAIETLNKTTIQTTALQNQEEVILSLNTNNFTFYYKPNSPLTLKVYDISFKSECETVKLSISNTDGIVSVDTSCKITNPNIRFIVPNTQLLDSVYYKAYNLLWIKKTSVPTDITADGMYLAVKVESGAGQYRFMQYNPLYEVQQIIDNPAVVVDIIKEMDKELYAELSKRIDFKWSY